MKYALKLFVAALFLFLLNAVMPASGHAQNSSESVPILLYHRFGPTVADSMTVTTPVFVSHLEYLKANGYVVIPLRKLLDYRLRKGPPLPPKSVVITIDDAHKTVYTEMLPLVKKYRIPVTLFVYPSAISNASYAMTWDQLREVKKTGLFDIQSHTYWHANFKQDRKKMSQQEYEKSVDMQLRKSKSRLEKELGSTVDMISWPFGIYDDWLCAKATEAGYVAAFTIDRRQVTDADQIMKLPRFLLTNANKGKAFEWIVAKPKPEQASAGKGRQ